MSYLNDLVWVGNALLPRWLPLACMALIALAVMGVFVLVTR